MSSPKPTQLGTGSGSTPATSQVVVKHAQCPRCAAPFHDRPFCPNDGEVAGAFVLGERYRVEERLGAGGMAFVFGGRHLVLGKRVALKVLRPELGGPEHAQRFLREARLASQLHHENIVAVTDFGHDGALDLHFLAMDRIAGVSLADTLKSEGALPWSRAVPILVQVARALMAAHDHGVVHRDLTPRNLMLSHSSGRRDVVKLCDFGLSRTIVGDDRLTSTGQMIGTPAYMSPEQLRGEVSQDGAIDVYALGTIAYEMLSGSLPFASPTPVAMIAAKLRDRATPLGTRSRVPRELDALVLRCLDHDPHARPSASEIEAALSSLSLHTAADAEPTDLIGTTVGSYRITALLGTGGMGSVYRAVHPQIGTEVAIKVLLPEVAASSDVIDRFVLEARASSAIGSPHIPRYFDFGTLRDGRAYAVMELLEGETLAERLQRSGPMPLTEVVRVLDQAADALGRAHAARVIHRDVKPDNLFLARGDGGAQTLKVLDFGIAKSLTHSGASANTKATQAGTFIGTPAYCAPEQMYGGAVGPATDVYALGATAFEMLTGAPPFDAANISQLFVHKASGAVPSARARNPALPAAVDRTLSRALALHAADRFATMEELRASLRTWVETSPSAHGEAPAARVVRRRSTGLWAVGLGVLLACGAAVAIAFAIAIASRGSDAPADAPAAGTARPAEQVATPAEPAVLPPPEPPAAEPPTAIAPAREEAAREDVPAARSEESERAPARHVETPRPRRAQPRVEQPEPDVGTRRPTTTERTIIADPFAE
ncbi:serine/threonine-protein kinase [Sandaracinus amylolyticus]|uniref:serine/threonine-protein kinase n=1 Tax=Sandaracinus amylolyticus TaxID=927083 RepID=UPI001F234251|nr:serine/threonine-protein kinase [Sandaracinus amylolyticus]UJR79723.1 Hypothetical protein I5071_17610 [Sandaracinus amylolyticus]